MDAMDREIGELKSENENLRVLYLKALKAKQKPNELEMQSELEKLALEKQ